MKRRRIFLSVVSTVLAVMVSVFFCACNFGSLNHAHSFVKYVSDENATCTANGTETAKCEKCDKTDTREIPDSKAGHSFVNYVSDENATCTANGTETAKCENCDATDTREVADSKACHSFVNYVSNGDATCTANGTETAKCEKCDKTDTREIPDSKTEHSFTNFIPNNDATTEADGTKTAKCDYCDEEKTVVDEGSKLEGEHTHSYSETVFTPTCTEDGYTLYVCECGKSEYKDKFVDKLGHSFTNYISDGNATTEADGTKTAKCDRCDVTDTVLDEGSKLPSTADGGRPAKGSEEEIGDAKFSIHFLELGNKYTGDCTLIKCGDTEVLIDAGSRQSSGATIKNYVDKYCTDGVLEYVIVTHAHQDHIAGFVGNPNGGTYDGILYQYEVGTLIQFSGHKTTSNIYKQYCTAVEYVQNKGTAVYDANQCWYETDGAKKQYLLDDAQTLSLNILYNYYYDHSTSNENNYSVCTLLTNEDGDKTTNYLFTGDLEDGGEKKLVQYNSLPEVELYKGGHHGSSTSSCDELLSVIKPKHVAICTCCGTTEYTTNPLNTFPTQETINRLAKYTENIYCTTLIVDYSAGKYTSMNGNIVFYYTDKVKLYCSNNDMVLKDTEWFKENRTWPEGE